MINVPVLLELLSHFFFAIHSLLLPAFLIQVFTMFRNQSLHRDDKHYQEQRWRPADIFVAATLLLGHCAFKPIIGSTTVSCDLNPDDLYPFVPYIDCNREVGNLILIENLTR